MAGDIEGTATYNWSDKTKLLSYVPYEWPARITEIRGHRVTFDRPLPLDRMTALGASIVTERSWDSIQERDWSAEKRATSGRSRLE